MPYEKDRKMSMKLSLTSTTLRSRFFSFVLSYEFIETRKDTTLCELLGRVKHISARSHHTAFLFWKIIGSPTATSTIQSADQLYGDRSAGVKDQFGNPWWIATHKEDLSKDEIAKRMDDHAKKQT
jgi:hypothetical protein